ncbi:hypothetical protein HX13_07500 [Chryseobacterium sp. P1-3]|nr:hypothetical protein HX13_07500 [Chryseobacterium sp. P1-3]
MKTKLINYIIGFILIIYYYFSIKTSYNLIVLNKGGWYFGEWIINYQDGGFKRRGLLGTLFIWINELTDIKLEHIVFAFIFFTLYCLFFLFYSSFFWKEKKQPSCSNARIAPCGFRNDGKRSQYCFKKRNFIFLFILGIYFMSPFQGLY